MANLHIGPHLLGSNEYANSATVLSYPGIGLNSSNNSVALPESWNPSTSNTSSLYRGGICYTLFYTGTTASTYNKFLAGGASGTTRLNIYSGGRPSLSSITNLNDYSSNLLISFSIPAFSTTASASGLNFNFGPNWVSGTTAGTSGFSPTIDHNGIVVTLGICPTFTAAVASGNATWFWFGNYSSPSALTGLSYVTGSIGLSGTNSDMEMADTYINSGDLYKSFGFKFTVPVTHEV